MLLQLGYQISHRRNHVHSSVSGGAKVLHLFHSRPLCLRHEASSQCSCCQFHPKPNPNPNPTSHRHSTASISKRSRPLCFLHSQPLHLRSFRCHPVCVMRAWTGLGRCSAFYLFSIYWLNNLLFLFYIYISLASSCFSIQPPTCVMGSICEFSFIEIESLKPPFSFCYPFLLIILISYHTETGRVKSFPPFHTQLIFSLL